MRTNVLFYTFLGIFVATTVVTLGGLINWFTIDEGKLDLLVGAFLIELAGAVIAIYQKMDFTEPNKGEGPQRAYIDLWIRSINEAKNRVQMLGINFLGELHDRREHLIALLNDGGEVQILLLSTESDAFRQREREEGEHENGTISRRLRAEANAALEIIRDVNLFRKSGSLELRMFEEAPTSAILVVDNQFVLFNPYTKIKDRGDPAEVMVSRGIQGGFEKYSVGDGLFTQKVDEFTSLWVKASPVDLSLEN